jgi:hypothetical protein
MSLKKLNNNINNNQQITDQRLFRTFLAQKSHRPPRIQQLDHKWSALAQHADIDVLPTRGRESVVAGPKMLDNQRGNLLGDLQIHLKF